MANKPFDDRNDDVRAMEKSVSTAINSTLIAFFAVLAAAMADVEWERVYLHRGTLFRSGSIVTRLVLVPLIVLGILIANARTTPRQWLIGLAVAAVTILLLLLAFGH